MELGGRIAFITGGASGMGRATARRLTAEGMKVCVADIDPEGVQAVADEIGGFAVTVDVSDYDQMSAAVAACAEHFGGLDLAYLNAGIGGVGDPDDFDLAQYRRTIGINQDGVVFGTVAALRAMRNRPDGRTGGVIVATASIAGLEPFAPSPFYPTSKHAVVGFIRSMGQRLAPEGITAHAICPALTDTNMVPEAAKEGLRASGVPIVAPEDIAAAVVNAATSPDELTGTCWVVQAGKDPYAFDFARVPGHQSYRP